MSADTDYEVLRTQGQALLSVRHGAVLMQRSLSEVVWGMTVADKKA